LTETLSLEKRTERIGASWQRFIVKGKIESYVVSEIIANSWQRSLEAGVNPFVNLQTFFTVKNIIDYKYLVKVSRPFLDNLYAFVKGSDFLVLLTDADGTIIKVLGDPVIVQKLKNIPFREGVNWGEGCLGTNCIALAVKEKIPVHVFAAEHFIQQLHSLVGSAAPFFCQNGNLLGVIAMFGLFKDFHPHTLGMVVASVKAIENQILYMEANRSLKRSYREVTTIMEEITAGLISADHQGRVSMLNTAACKMLGINYQAGVSQHLGQLFGKDCPFLQAMEEDLEYSDRDITLSCNGITNRFYCSLRIIRDENNKKLGMVITLREHKAIRRLVNRAFGAQATFTFSDIYGEHLLIKKAINAAQRAAHSNNTILIVGESGTGKEMFAQAIHNESERCRGPFVAINCAGIPRELVESELFGYEAGAFTGARREGRPGKFELAQGGTLFLDEIGDMPLEMQAKLLRVLQDKFITRLGGDSPILADVRVIVATNRNIFALVEEGTFRPDLFYRINVITLQLPSLRTRETDILLLANLFLEKAIFKMGLPSPPRLSGRLEERLLRYSWPGNVRELQNVIEQMVFNANGSLKLDEEHLPEKMMKTATTQSGSEDMALEAQELKHILLALEMCQGNIAHSARLLGIGRNTLYRKINKYNLHVPRSTSSLETDQTGYLYKKR
jgi:transcriptional regulator of acetoin/glycerol metabolism